MKEFGLRIAEVPNWIAMPPPAPEAGETLNLRRLLAAGRRQRWVFALWVAIAVAAGIAYLATTPRTYFTGSTVLLAGNVNRVIEEMSSVESTTNTENELESAQEVIRSQQIALAVTDALQLQRNESFLNPPVSGASRLVDAIKSVLRAPINLLRSDTPAAAQDADSESAKRDAVALDLRQEIQISRVGRSSAFFIGFASHDPLLAKQIADAYAKAYVADLLNANFEATEQTTEWLQVRLNNLQDSAQQAAMAAERFRTENGLVSSRGALMTEENVQQLNTDLAEAVAELARSRALMDTYDDVLKQGPNALIDEDGLRFTLPGDDRLQLMQEELSTLIGRLTEVERNPTANQVEASALRGKVDQLLQTLFAEMGRLAEAARGEFAVADARVAALRDSLGLAVDTNSAASEAQVQLRALEQRALTLSMLYQTFLTRFQEMDQQKTFPISNVRILSAAEMPKSHYSPSTSRVLALMLVLGLLAGFATAIIREWRDRFLRTGEDVQAETGSKFLGYLPLVARAGAPAQAASASRGPLGILARLRLRRAARARQELQFRHRRGLGPLPTETLPPHDTRSLAYVAENPRSLFAETVRNIRFASDVRMGDRPGRIIGVTSVLPGEGKSTIAANLATMMAAFDDPVLLIDADPRNPGLSRSLQMTGKPGLVEALIGKADWRSLIQVQQDTGVHLLTCETPKLMSYSSELLGSATMRALLAELRHEFPTIILDMAPLGPVVDARVLLPMVDQVVLVAEWGMTPKELLRSTLGLEPLLAEKLLGVVLNKVDMVALRDYVPRVSNDAYYLEYGDYFSHGK